MWSPAYPPSQPRGTVSMRQTPDGFTSWYFFIIAQDNPALDSGHVPFAKVIEGMDVIQDRPCRGHW